MNSLSCSSSRFGELEFTAEDVVTVPRGLLGFPDSREYVVIEHREGSPFRWLQSTTEPALAFLVVDPATYVPDYAPDMPDDAANQLQVDNETTILVYTIVTIPAGHPEEMTLNLAGPVVINCDRQLAFQVVLQDERYPVKYKAIPAKQESAAA